MRWLRLFGLLLLICVLASCASSTVASRIKERAAAFSQLTPEQQQLVQKGEIRVGMPSDAVYVALGPPSDIVENEDARGHVTTWIYYGQTVEEMRFWAGRHLESEFYPRSYVQAEIDFADGKVVRWRTLPKPPVY